jgi:hypothetical protein
MLAQLHLGLGLVHWEAWTAPTIGLSAAGLILILALSLLRQRQPAPPFAPAKVASPRRDSPDLDHGKERRGSIRRAGKLTPVLVSNADATAEPFPGLVCNRSIGGLRLSVPQAVEQHQILSVRPAEANAEAPWVQVEVRWCRTRDPGRWELGCHFVRTPPYSQLVLFG